MVKLQSRQKVSTDSLATTLPSPASSSSSSLSTLTLPPCRGDASPSRLSSTSSCFSSFTDEEASVGSRKRKAKCSWGNEGREGGGEEGTEEGEGRSGTGWDWAHVVDPAEMVTEEEEEEEGGEEGEIWGEEQGEPSFSPLAVHINRATRRGGRHWHEGGCTGGEGTGGGEGVRKRGREGGREGGRGEKLIGDVHSCMIRKIERTPRLDK
ncbi:hypothetical protein Naga_101565g1 [Nannochloropsis gaditana]|uniref:Uncharacterized protein n=1 Tax=Nannochloropsis gaditana TaxID=72520 RepID=W7T2A7_9STRA|nr:hypothetical protein Naga_101565g1 [Nannochloropsis gaditana]